MNYRYYKAAAERTDEDERLLIPPFEKTPFDEKREHEHDLEEESKRDYYEVDNNEETERETHN